MSGAEQRALAELNVRRETWCRVEGNPHQEWERRERRHYRKHLRSTAGLLKSLPQERPAARPEEREHHPLIYRRGGTSRRAMNHSWCKLPDGS
ncbi:Spermatogenesis-associated protein 45 [Dissostichus eleginoides]|uniref:Spermatogenesis-associated protein 45 n=1 Tax=Dissostichus eleginoides TaxID=100907 RepID=A0AAD9F591_DISEL|nr:Spermatogenesis-associated protein 45 [Dissostichus eleginoides]